MSELVRSKSRRGTPAQAHSHLRRTRRFILSMVVLTVVLLALITVALSIGAARIPIVDVVRVVFAQLPWTAPAGADLDVAQTVIISTRAPRVLLAVGVGAVLAVVGVVLQALTRNPLADPHILGISAGASSGAALAMTTGVVAVLGQAALPVAAFVGAVATLVCVLVFSQSHSGTDPLKLILVGVAVGYGFTALTNVLIFLSPNPESSRGVMFWMLGTLTRASWLSTVLLLVLAVLFCFLVTAFSDGIDAVSAGDHIALTVGVNPRVIRGVLLVLASFAVAATVPVVGGIGFIGLIMPHAARALVGHRHKLITPVAAVFGAIVLLLADLIARTVFAPQELPIGVVTGLMGAPFIIYILRKGR
jgi:iron complex transport system permease protein